MADTLRIKRRSSGNPGAPTQLAYAELAFNEVDNILYYGRGNNAGQAVTIIPIAGPGYVVPPTPAGLNTQVQFNDGGAFGGDAGLTYDKNTDTLTAGDIKVAQWNGVQAPVELKLQSTGGGWGTSILRIKNETGVNGAMFETQPNPGAELVDFVFKVGNITQQNIRLEARPAQLLSGNSWEFQLGSAGSAQCLVGNSLVKLNLLTLKSDGTLTVAIGGQITFQYDPNTNNGTFTLGAKPPHGQLLQFCARSDITGSARFFGAAGYSFDARISVPSDPTSALELATKQYVDNKAGAGGTSITVSDTPPGSPADNSLWFESDTGALWLRYNDGNSTQWITISVPPGPTMGFLPLTGGTITGDLTISHNLLVSNYAELGGGQSDGNFIFLSTVTGNGLVTLTAVGQQIILQPGSGDARIDLRKGTGANNLIIGKAPNGNFRWFIMPGDSTTETGSSNIGSNFSIQRYNDAGSLIDTPLQINRSTGNMTLLGMPLQLSKAASGQAAYIAGMTGAANRWSVTLGDGSTETGSGNAGSDFRINRYNDAGTLIDTPLMIYRTSGNITLNTPLFGTNITANNFFLPNMGTLYEKDTGGTDRQIITIWNDNRTYLGDGNLVTRVRGTVVELYTGPPVPTGGCIRFGLLTGAWGITSLPAAAGTTYPGVFLTSVGGVIGSISSSDTATGFNNASDGRLKEDLKDFDAGSIIDAIKVYDFAWKVNGARAHGIVAQEAVEVYPEAVTHDVDRDIWFIDYSKYVPLLLQELKALRERVAMLESR